ncbi:hypothetical protein [Clostridium botulinum]|nr:hypothetical protein [Clostridium botulinum]
MQYCVNSRTFTKQSPPFGPGQSEKLSFSTHAKNICFNVFNNSTNPPTLLFNVVLPYTMKFCYKLIQTPNGPQLIEFYC